MMARPEFAVSVRQPWAWAIVAGFKDIENRTTFAINKGRLDLRGPICVHASKGMTRDEYDSARDFMAALAVECPPAADLVRGAIIGAVEVVDCVRKSDSPWFVGPRGLVLRNPVRFGLPIPCVGQLGRFQWRGSDGEVEKPLPWMLGARRAPGAVKTQAPSTDDLFSRG